MYDYYKDIPFDSIPKGENETASNSLENNSSKTENVTFDYYQHIPLDEVTKN